MAEVLSSEDSDQWWDKRMWAQGKTDGISWAMKAILFQCEHGQRVKDVVESSCWGLLNTQMAIVLDKVL